MFKWNVFIVVEKETVECALECTFDEVSDWMDAKVLEWASHSPNSIIAFETELIDTSMHLAWNLFVATLDLGKDAYVDMPRLQ